MTEPTPVGGNRLAAIVSGGMDSTALAYWLWTRGKDVHILSVDYGQRHSRELEYAEHTARLLSAPFDVIDLRSVGALLTGSALTDDAVDVPEGHYADDTMAATVVPNRNMMMLSAAAAIAAARDLPAVATAVHAGDHPVYSDCRPEFIDAVAHASTLACRVGIVAPFVHMTKADIARVGDRIGVPWADTWTCYRGGDVHCGRCSTCVERIEAFHLAGVADPTEYADREYWRTVTDQAAV